MLFHYGFLLGKHVSGKIVLVNGATTSYPVLYEYSNFGWVGVETFFVISGFVIAYSAEKATPFSFFSSRVTRLGPGVWICASLTLLATLAVGLNTHDEIKAYLHSILFVPIGPWIDGVYWTLRIEIAFYFLVFLLLCFGKFNWIKHLALTIGSISCFYWVGVTLFGLGSGIDNESVFLGIKTLALLDMTLVHHGLFFALGVLLWLQLTKEKNTWNLFWSLLFVICGFLQIISESQVMNIKFDVNYSAYIPCGIWLISLVAIIASVRYNKLFHALPIDWLVAFRTLGLMTFPLYLFHQIIGSAVIGILVRQGVNRWTALLITSAFVFSSVWVIASYLEPELQKITKNTLLIIKNKLNLKRLV